MHNDMRVRPTPVIGEGSVAWYATTRNGMLSFVRSVFAVVGADLPPNACPLEQRLQMTGAIHWIGRRPESHSEPAGGHSAHNARRGCHTRDAYAERRVP